MQYLKGSGLRLRDNYLPSVTGSGDVVVISEEILPSGPSGLQKAGNLSIVVGISEVMSEYNIPNPVDYVKGLVGYHTKNEALVEKFDSQFRTLGNGKFELNDILAFPVNWGHTVTEFISRKLGGEGRGPKYNAPGYTEFVREGRPGVFTEKKSSGDNTSDNHNNPQNGNGNGGANYGQAR